MNRNEEYLAFDRRLDAMYPIDSLFSKEDRDRIINREVTPSKWLNIFKDSLLKNASAELLLGRFIEEACRAGQWVNISMKENLSREINIGFGLGYTEFLLLDNREAIELMLGEGFITKERDQGGIYLKPTELMLDFIKGRVENKKL